MPLPDTLLRASSAGWPARCSPGSRRSSRGSTCSRRERRAAAGAPRARRGTRGRAQPAVDRSPATGCQRGRSAAIRTRRSTAREQTDEGLRLIDLVCGATDPVAAPLRRMRRGRTTQTIFKEEDMSLRIQTNIEAFNAHATWCSTGRRCRSRWRSCLAAIGSTAPPTTAAGLAISEKLRAQVGGLDQAQRNAQDAVSLVQTAEGAMGEVHVDAPARSRPGGRVQQRHAVGSDKAAITAEVAQLCDEISADRHRHQVQRHRAAHRLRRHHLPGRRQRRRDDLGQRRRAVRLRLDLRRRLRDLQLRHDGHAGRHRRRHPERRRPPARRSAPSRTGSSTRSTTWPPTRRT